MSDFTARFSYLFERNKKALYYVLICIIIVFASIIYYKFYVQKPRDQAAYEKLAFAEEQLRVDSLDKALNGQGRHIGLLKIISEYEGSPAANLAYYYTGVALLKKGDFQKAINYLDKFETENVLARARKEALLGDAYGELGTLEKAFSYYEHAAKLAKDDDEWAASCLFKAGRVMEETKKEQAIACYQKIKNDYPFTAKAKLAEKYLARLGVFD